MTPRCNGALVLANGVHTACDRRASCARFTGIVRHGKLPDRVHPLRCALWRGVFDEFEPLPVAPVATPAGQGELFTEVAA